MGFIIESKIVDAIRSGSYLYLGNMGDPKFNMYNMIKLIPHMPKPDVIFHDQQERFQMTGLEKQTRTPRTIKNVIKDLSTVFYKNNITLHVYASLSENSVGHIHADNMDVVYLQGYGDVDWTIWDNVNGENMLYEKRLEPGDIIYVPKGVAHRSAPASYHRIGFSFGAEGKASIKYV